MRNKKEFSFDEETDAEAVIKDGFPNGNIDYSKMYLVAKYLRKNLKYGAVRLERELIHFCQTQNPNFNPIIESEALKKWVNSAISFGLRKVNSVTMTQKEIDFLKTIKIIKDRKILYITLLFSKALKQGSTKLIKGKVKLSTSPHYYVHYSNFQNILRLAGIKNVSDLGLALIYRNYHDCFTFYNAEKELIRLEYVDKEGSGIEIENMDDLMSYYDAFFGKSSLNCEKCGKTIEKTGNNKKYCNSCAREIKAEKDRVRMMRIRSK